MDEIAEEESCFEQSQISVNNVSHTRTFIYSQEDMDVYNGSSSEGDGDDLPQF